MKNERRIPHDHKEFRKDADWLYCHACCELQRAAQVSAWPRWQGKVTLSQFLQRRMRASGAFSIDPVDAHLFYAPIDLPRDNLRQRIKLADKTLASRAAKFLTLAEEYSKRRQFAKDMAKPPHVPFHLQCTRQSKPKPFESGHNCLPGMESFYAQIERFA